MTRVRTRFAPSPTGTLHVGNARIAVLNWLWARHNDGDFILRIEDTDVGRNVEGAESGIYEDLSWLGLDWDEGPRQDGGERGRHGPYHQSRRTGHYRREVERLLEAGLAYRCYCSPSELERHRRGAVDRGEPAVYPGTCRGLEADEIGRREADGLPYAVRFHVPDEGEIVVEDAVRGPVRFARREIGDFVILRSDGVPTYNFAVVVDDALMAVSHVIRGAGHLSNTPRQLALYQALDRPPPVFAHIPTVLGPDRQKLSKRHGAQPLAELRREGYHPHAVVNYLSLLSWSSPSGDEVLDRDRLINEISLDRVGASDVVFDIDKLRWLSAKHIERMELSDLVDAVRPYVDRDRFPIPDASLPTVVAAVRSHLSVLSDIGGLLAPFVPSLDEQARSSRDAMRRDPDARRTLAAVVESLEALDSWRADEIQDALRAAGREAGARGAALFVPVRVAVTGREHGPPLGAVMEALGRAACLRLLVEQQSPPAGGAATV